MRKKIKANPGPWLMGLVVICFAVILLLGNRYLAGLQNDLRNNSIQDVNNVTRQQEQALDNFIGDDRARLHGYALYFSHTTDTSAEAVRHLLTLFQGVDAVCTVACLDEGWICSSHHEEILGVDAQTMAIYRSLSGSGVRDRFKFLSGDEKFSYYETFAFENGHKGIIQKSYDRSKVLEDFPLSLYDGQGYGYVLNSSGDILLRSVASTNARSYNNVFEALADTNASPEDTEHFRTALKTGQSDSTIFESSNGSSYVYTYLPMQSVEDWYFLSIVPVDAIRSDSDQMLRNSKLTLWLFDVILAVCAVFVALMWRARQDLAAADEEVAYQAQLFESFIAFISQNTDDVYLMMDQNTERLEYVSPNLERVLGLTQDTFFDVFREADMAADPEGTQAYYDTLNRLTPGQSAPTRNTERTDPKTGETRFFWESAYCTDVQGRLKRVCCISDRTKERKSQAALTEALHMAQAASDAKSAFLSNVSHDIRTPMNAIIGFLALMRDEADNPDVVMEYTQRIDSASQHLLGLINDVLDMNKIENGGATLNLGDINMAEIIDEINTIIRPQAKSRNQTFDILVPTLKYEHLQGDKLRINQILINLLSNAVKYTHEGGHIQMRVEELPQVMDKYSRIRIIIQDDGMGMSPEYLDVIFDPFTREEAAVTKQIQGTGLGMAITKNLVDLMGGTIQVESQLDVGSTFTVELELRVQDAPTSVDEAGFWSDHQVERMLVADDEEETCKGIVHTMGSTGVATDYVTAGENVVPTLRHARESGRPYDLILLDWKMPGLNGLETARLIRKNYPDKIPILLLTAYDWSEIEQEAMEIGVNHFMPKPFFMSNFKAAIRRVMGSDEEEAHAALSSDVVRGLHILIVDDIEVNRILLLKILATLGAECDTAANGQEAVDKFLEAGPGEYDLILMDVQMPVMDGYTATRTIRASDHPAAQFIPIVAMTANAFVDDVRDALDAGMDAHIAKPVQLDNLKTTIQQVLDHRLEEAERRTKEKLETSPK